MKKLVLAGALALVALGLVHQDAKAVWPCTQVIQPCWEIPLPRLPIVVPNVKFYCADCCGFQNPHYTQAWYLYYPPQANYGYTSPWYSYAAPHAYPYASAGQAPNGYAAAPGQNYAPQGFAPQNHQVAGQFAAPAYWYGR